jgi:hypothetical protein
VVAQPTRNRQVGGSNPPSGSRSELHGHRPGDGRQRQISRQVKGSRKQAERVETRLKAEVMAGRHRGTAAKTLGEMVGVYLDWREQNGKPIGPRTIQGYRALAEARIKPGIGKPAGARPPHPRGRPGTATATGVSTARLGRAGRADDGPPRPPTPHDRPPRTCPRSRSSHGRIRSNSRPAHRRRTRRS